MASDVTVWDVQRYCTDSKQWKSCFRCDVKTDAVGHYNLLERMYKDTAHRVMEITVVEKVIIGAFGLRYDG
jgi:hypothetical protein